MPYFSIKIVYIWILLHEARAIYYFNELHEIFLFELSCQSMIVASENYIAPHGC
jgi:hypothetical protein